MPELLHYTIISTVYIGMGLIADQRSSSPTTGTSTALDNGAFGADCRYLDWCI